MSATRIALAVVGLIALPVAWGAYSTFSAVVTAPSRVINRTLQTDNIISNYEFFRDANNQFAARVAQASAHKKILADTSDAAERSRLRIELAAIQQSCRDLGAKYNANAEKMNRSVFRAGAPESLNVSECE